MNDRIERIKSHVRENKKVYITGVVCLAVGATTSAALLSNSVIVDSFKFQWKSVSVNEVTTVMARRGHPGNMVKCNETGEVFASLRRAAQVMNVDRSGLQKHLKGEQSNVDGFTFASLGEAA